MAKKSKGNTLKITPVKALKLQKIFIKLGFNSYQVKSGSHILVEVPQIKIPLVFGNHPNAEISPIVVNKLIKKAGISKKQYLDAFNQL